MALAQASSQFEATNIMKLLHLGLLAAAVFGAVPAGVASGGQGSAPVHPAPAPTPTNAPPTRAPAPPAPSTAAPAPPAPPPAPTSMAAKILIPANVFKLPAAQMLTVNGQQMTAGALRQDIQSQIAKQAPPPTLVNVASGKKPTRPVLSMPAPTHQTMAPNLDCSNRSPTLFGVTGAVTPGQEITLSGACFGDQTGQVKLIGPFPGGSLSLTFSKWSAGKIIAAVPAVRGVSDQTVAISVVTSAKVESPSKPVTFLSTRERVEVPARFWTPGTHFGMTWQLTLVDPPKADTSPTQFSVTVNPACALDTMDATATVGAVTGVTGWSDGPPNAATVQVAWVPQETSTTYYYVIVKETDHVLSTSIDVKAWASCPLGVAP